MKRTALAIALLAAVSMANAGSWTYQGTLNDGGRPAHGRYTLRLTLVDEAGTRSLAQPVTLFNVEVRNGNFAVDADFGLDLSQAPPLKLKTEVAQGGSAFASIGEPTRFDPKAALAGICWDTTGNVAAAGEFLGSTNNVPMEIRANNQRVARFDAAGGANDVRVTLGSPSNVTSGVSATIGGGINGVAAGQWSVLAGGQSNRTEGAHSTVSGGSGNGALASASVVAGGVFNAATGTRGVVAGGESGTASGAHGFVAGGYFNCAGGQSSFAGGRRAKVRPGTGSGAVGEGCSGTATSGTAEGDAGSFVWADAQDADYVSTGRNQFLARAGGGVMFNANALPEFSTDDLVIGARPATSGGDADTDVVWLSRSGKQGRIYLQDATGGFFLTVLNLTPSSNRLNVFGGGSGTASLSHGGVWTNASSRAFKEGFAAVDPLAILDKVVALPITTWTYKQSAEGTHMGPMAEDFQASFGLAGDGTAIGTVDADGVALAAIQGLNQKLERARAENQALKTRLEAIEAMLAK